MLYFCWIVVFLCRFPIFSISNTVLQPRVDGGGWLSRHEKKHGELLANPFRVGSTHFNRLSILFFDKWLDVDLLLFYLASDSSGVSSFHFGRARFAGSLWQIFVCFVPFTKTFLRTWSRRSLNCWPSPIFSFSAKFRSQNTAKRSSTLCNSLLFLFVSINAMQRPSSVFRSTNFRACWKCSCLPASWHCRILERQVIRYFS